MNTGSAGAGKLAPSSSGGGNSVGVGGKNIRIGNYVLGTTIGKGNSAVVKIATHSITKQKVAIKMFDKSGLDSDKQLRLRREIDSMKQLKHQNIIQLFEIMETTKLICLVTEYAANGELYDYIIHKKRLSEREAKHIFKQIVAALHYCHANHIVHRDIKVENLLLDSFWHIKLADFGFSTKFKPNELLDTWCGSPPYCSPELYLAQLYDGPKVDIWSLGVVLYVLVCGYLPFEAQVFSALRAQVISGAYKMPFFLSEECKALINGMLTVDTSKRFTMSEIINHRWLVAAAVAGQTSNTTATNAAAATAHNAEPAIYSEFRNLIDKVENITIREFEPNEEVLNEVAKYGFNREDVAKSVRNHEFDSNAGLYYIIEAKLNACGPSPRYSSSLSPHNHVVINCHEPANNSSAPLFFQELRPLAEIDETKPTGPALADPDDGDDEEDEDEEDEEEDDDSMLIEGPRPRLPQSAWRTPAPYDRR